MNMETKFKLDLTPEQTEVIMKALDGRWSIENLFVKHVITGVPERVSSVDPISIVFEMLDAEIHKQSLLSPKDIVNREDFIPGYVYSVLHDGKEKYLPYEKIKEIASND